ncbi:hypothetical protein OIV19_18470 [Brucella sp. HL-2]|nr:hypothetical protein [Brucella sp. HL-2]MCV9909589.1 hypothetical protein [Brucella sp. HL-2]
MATSKWFDLRNVGAILERIKNDESGVFLKLTVKEPADYLEKASDIVSAGWQASADEPNVFINNNRMDAMSDIKASLCAFFDKDAIALNDLSKLPGNIYVGGYERGKSASPETILSNILGLDDASQEKILKRVVAAAALAGLNNQVKVPFDGQLLKVWDAVYDRYPEHATGMIVLAVQEYTEGNIEKFELLENAIMQDSIVGAYYKIPYELEAKIHKISAEIDNSIYVKGARLPQKDGMLSYKEAAKKCHLGFLHQNLSGAPVTFLDAHIVRKRASGEKLPDKVGNINIRYEASLPTELKWQSSQRIIAAVQAFESVFGNGTDSVFGPHSLTIMVTKNGMPDNALGLYKARASTDISVSQVIYSPYSAYALVHELAHAMDFGNRNIGLDASDPGSTESKFKRVIIDTHAAHQVRGFVESAIKEGADMSQQHADYLQNPSEIFARSVHAVMIDHYLAKGDSELQALGGANREFSDFAIQDRVHLKKFKDAVIDWNNEFAASYKMDQSQKLERDSSAERDMVSFG